MKLFGFNTKSVTWIPSYHAGTLKHQGLGAILIFVINFVCLQFMACFWKKKKKRKLANLILHLITLHNTVYCAVLAAPRIGLCFIR